MKTVDEIYRQMLEVFEKKTGLTAEDGCDLAARLYAAAGQIQALLAQSQWVLEQSFPQTATGEFLQRHAWLRGVEKARGSCARGVLRFFVPQAVKQDLSVPEGTVCMTVEGRRFTTTETAVLPAGELWVDVPARAVEIGSGGNVRAETVICFSAAPVGITACSNPEGFWGGEDEETDEELRRRILETYRRLPNGANAVFYEQQAMNHPEVARAVAVGRARGIGTVDLYIASEGGMPEEALCREVAQKLESMREIAVDLQVKAPQEETVNVAVSLEIAAGKDAEAVVQAVEEKLHGYFTGALLGQRILLAELGRLVYETEGVANYHILEPVSDIEPAATALPVLKSLSVTAESGVEV